MINFLFKVFEGEAGLEPSPSNTLNMKLVIEVKVGGRQHAEGLPPTNLYFYYVYMKIGGERAEPCSLQQFTCRRRSSCWWTAACRRPAVHQQLLLLLLHVCVGRAGLRPSPNINIEVVVFEKVVGGRQHAEGLPPDNYLFKQYFSWCWDGSMPEACRPNTN